MFYRVREFAEGIGSPLAGGLALLIGAMVGALVTVQMSGGTPYSQADLDRVADHGRAVASGAAQATSAAGRPGRGVSRLQDRNERLAGQLSAANGTIADLREQLAFAKAAATPSATPTPTAAPTVPAAPSITVSVPSATPSATASATRSPSHPVTHAATHSTAPSTHSTVPSTPPAGLRVTGTLAVSWVLSAERKPWPRSCSEIGSGYRVRVGTPDHKTVVGVPTAFRSTGRSAKGGVLSVSCDVTYSAVLPAPVSGVYQLVAIKAGRPGRHLDTARARGAQLSGGHVPALGVTFCPDCPAQG